MQSPHGISGAAARYQSLYESPEFIYCPRSNMFVLMSERDLTITTPPCELPHHRPWYWVEDVSLAQGCTIWRARVRQERARLERERQADLTLLPSPDISDIPVRSGESKKLVFDAQTAMSSTA